MLIGKMHLRQKKKKKKKKKHVTLVIPQQYYQGGSLYIFQILAPYVNIWQKT